MWRPKVGGGCLLQTLSLVFEAGSLIELGAMLADLELQDPLVFPSTGMTASANPQSFLHGI